MDEWMDTFYCEYICFLGTTLVSVILNELTLIYCVYFLLGDIIKYYRPLYFKKKM